MKKEKGNPEEIKALMDLAESDLASGNLNFKKGFYRQAVVSAYYVTLSSSRALLLNEGFLPKSRKGVFAMLSLHIIKKEILPKIYSSQISKLFKDRLDANYSASSDFSYKDAKESLEFAEEFFEKIKKIIK